MKEKQLWFFWGLLFIMCAGLGFIHDATGIAKLFQILLSVLFFVPPTVLLVRALKQEQKKTVRLIRYFSLSSLCLTLVLLVANVLSVGASEALGDALYYFLIVLSAPMVCSIFWALSLFLWACLLMGSFYRQKPPKKK